MNATDPDDGVNGEIQFEIMKPASDFFRIESEEVGNVTIGRIYLKGQIQSFESSQILTVLATDKAKKLNERR